jgi:hypothetical protein
MKKCGLPGYRALFYWLKASCITLMLASRACGTATIYVLLVAAREGWAT